nr:loricrin-like [Arachis hypogaea]
MEGRGHGWRGGRGMACEELDDDNHQGGGGGGDGNGGYDGGSGCGGGLGCSKGHHSGGGGSGGFNGGSGRSQPRGGEGQPAGCDAGEGSHVYGCGGVGGRPEAGSGAPGHGFEDYFVRVSTCDDSLAKHQTYICPAPSTSQLSLSTTQVGTPEEVPQAGDGDGTVMVRRTRSL